MGIVRSKISSLKPVGLEIDEGITLFSTGIVNINVPLIVNHVDFLPAIFKLIIRDKVIYIDPVVVRDEKKADYILITHSYQDYFSISDIKNLLKKETIVLCPRKVYGKLSGLLEGATLMEAIPGTRLDFGKITVESISAYNMKSSFLVAHPKSAMFVGYVISSGNIKIYHAGDTDYTPEMDRLEGITVALVPIDGKNLTMTTEITAEFINHKKPEFAIPLHYNNGTDGIEKFKSLINGDAKVVIMDGIHL